MSDSDFGDSSTNNPTASAILAKFLGMIHEAPEQAFESLCSRHESEAEELRRLYSAHKRAQADFAIFGPTHEEKSGPHYSEGARVGNVIGDFQLLSRIAAGGQGEVWEATQASLNRKVALKLVLPDRINSKTLDLFAREARAGGRLNHPGIVAVYGYGHDNGRHWIAQELIDGTWTLRDFIDDMRSAEGLPENYYRSVSLFLAELADALQAAHDAGVIHRDVKPHNVLVTPSDHPKLTDFGLARITDESAVSMTGDFAGTWLYMSPEQVTAKRIEIDHRTDIFSLGVVMYEMLALVRPFDGDTTHQIAENIVLREAPDLHKLRSRVPKELAIICGKALQKLRDARYQSMAEMAADIRRYLTNKPIHAKPPTVAERCTKWIRRNPTKSIVAGTMAIALTVISLLLGSISNKNDALENSLASEEQATAKAMAERDRAVTAEQLAVKRTYLANIQAASSAIQSGNTAMAGQPLEACPPQLRDWEWNHLDLATNTSLRVIKGGISGAALTWSENGPKVFVPYTDRASGTRGLYQWNVETQESLRCSAQQTERIQGCEVSPDGTRLLTGSWDPIATVWDMSKGFKVVRLKGHTDNVLGLTWAPDGARVATCGNDGTIRVWDSMTGENLQVFIVGTDTPPSYRLDWSPSGSLLAAGGGGGLIQIWDLKKGKCVQTLVGHRRQVTALEWSPSGLQLLSGSADHTLRIWDIESGRCQNVLRGHSGEINCAIWNPSGTFVVSGSRDWTVRIWDLAPGGKSNVLAGHSAPIKNVAWDPKGQEVVSADLNGEYRFWDLNTKANNLLVGHTGAYGSTLAWNHSSARLATFAHQSNSIRIWDSEEFALVRELQGHQLAVTGVDWSPSGEHLISVSGDKTARVWDVATGECAQVLKGHKDRISCVSWSSCGTRIVTGSDDGTLRVWDSQTWKCLNTIEGWKNEAIPRVAKAVAWNPQSTCIAAVSWAGDIRVWSVKTGETALEFSGRYPDFAESHSISWDPDGSKLMITGNVISRGNRSIEARILDANTGALLHRLLGHTDMVFSANWNTSGSRIVTASLDQTIRIWDPATGISLLTLTGNEGGAYSAAFNSVGTRIASTHGNGNLRMWESNIEEAMPLWRSEGERRKAEAITTSLFNRYGLLEYVQKALAEDKTLTPMLRDRAISLARVRGNARSEQLNSIAWPLADPDRDDKDTDVELALKCARQAVSQSPGSPNMRDTLAWALFANGLFVEAISTAEIALELASEHESPATVDEYKNALSRLRTLVGQDPTQHEQED